MEYYRCITANIPYLSFILSCSLCLMNYPDVARYLINDLNIERYLINDLNIARYLINDLGVASYLINDSDEANFAIKSVTYEAILTNAIL